MTLKSGLEVTQRHSNHSKAWVQLHLPSMVTMALSCIVCEIYSELLVEQIAKSGGNNFNNFPENQLTKFRAFRDSGRDSVHGDR